MRGSPPLLRPIAARHMHTLEQLRGGARDFCTVLDQAPSAFVWESYFTKAFAKSPVPPDSREALRNATIESSLLSVRILNDFFAPRRYPTDIRASDYSGYSSPGKFLTDREAKDLNKYLAHLTTERAEFHPKPWPIYDLLRRALDAAVTFLRFLLSPEGRQYHPDDLDVASRVSTCERIENGMRRFLKQPKA
jgi:hypothetical protein